MYASVHLYEIVMDMNMDVLVCVYVHGHIMHLYILYDCVYGREDETGVEMLMIMVMMTMMMTIIIIIILSRRENVSRRL